jgi:hypothetical protein
MRVVIAFAAVSLSLVAATPAVAQELKPPADLFAQQKKAPPKPPQVDWNRPPSPGATSAAKTTVVCGMTLVHADPKFDSRMRVAAPDSRVSYTMRTSPPPICKAP